MIRFRILRKISILCALGLLTVIMLACGLGLGAVGRPSVTITSPADGSRVMVGQDVAVQATAVDEKGVVRVELWVDGSVVVSQTSSAPQGQPTLKVALLWKPQDAGPHIVEAQAYNLDEVPSKPSTIRLTAFGGKEDKPTPEIAPTVAVATSPTPESGPSPAASCKDSAVFLADITVPDGTAFAPGAIFDKTWRIQNNGTCPWGERYKLAFFDGDQMEGPTEVDLPPAAPGETVDVTVKLRAPDEPGHYAGRWHPHNDAGVIFPGVLTVVVNVKQPEEPAPTPPPPQGPLPVIHYFRAEPETIAKGEAATLNWDLDGASGGAYLYPGGEGGIVAPGQMTVTPQETTTYRLVARNAAGETEATVTVTVQ
jgi:hypothetical protein